MTQPMCDSAGRRHINTEKCWCGYTPKKFGDKPDKPESPPTGAYQR